MEGSQPAHDTTGARAPEPVNAYRFILPTFQGPLDLLLHLIRVNEVDIKDIPVVEIARQYDRMLELMHEMNLDVAGEFLVMAATLVYIKSKMLLPVERERIEQGLEEDPRADLARALLEHQRFKRAAEKLAERERQAALVFTRPRDEAADEEGHLDVTLMNLIDALRDVVERAGPRVAMRFERQELPLPVMIERILSRLRDEDFVTFGALIAENEKNDALVLVVAFIAVLELIRAGKIRAYQTRPFDEIRLRRGAVA